MNPEQALLLLARVTAQVQATQADHDNFKEAVRVLNEAITVNSNSLKEKE